MPLSLFVQESLGHYRPVTTEEVMTDAKERMRCRYRRNTKLKEPQDTVDYLFAQLAHCENEVFVVIFLDTRHRVIRCEELFHGSIGGAAVHARVVLQKALGHNAAAVILAHNHPSGDPSPSQADRVITKRLQEALNLIDVRCLDHIIIGGAEHYSFAEHGVI